MRKLNKSATPLVLQNAQPPTDNKSIKDRIYKAVKNQLEQDQFSKCAYCESKYQSISYGEIEHYRPKKKWQQDKNDETPNSGYYWLAYHWDNLLVACRKCNSNKFTVFPLLDVSKRAITPSDNIAEEEPLIINPYFDDPSNHIRFNRHIAQNLTVKGGTTIKILDLNREALKNEREELYKLLETVSKIVSIEEYKNATSRFSQMCCDNF